MTDDQPVLNKGPPDLEARLAEKPHWGMDTMQFLVIAGLTTSSWEPLYHPDAAKVRERIREQHDARRDGMPQNLKNREHRFANVLANYYVGADKFKSLGELKEYVQKEGLKLHGAGYLGLHRFNEILQQYGLEPIRVGGKVYDKVLKKYGLERSKYAV